MKKLLILCLIVLISSCITESDSLETLQKHYPNQKTIFKIPDNSKYSYIITDSLGQKRYVIISKSSPNEIICSVKFN